MEYSSYNVNTPQWREITVGSHLPEMGMTLKELLTKGEGTLSAQEAKTLAAQCRMDVCRTAKTCRNRT